MDTFITWYDEIQPGLPKLFHTYDDWRNIHHCYHPAQEKWGFWWTHKENVGINHHCDGCDTDFMLVDGSVHSNELLTVRLAPETKDLLDEWIAQGRELEGFKATRGAGE